MIGNDHPRHMTTSSSAMMRTRIRLADAVHNPPSGGFLDWRATIFGMMNRALRFLSSETRGLHVAVYILATCALLSSLLALVRDRLFAATFGAGTQLDLYYAAFRIPDLIFVAMGALVSTYMLIPELSRRSRSEQYDYIDTIFAGFSLLAVIVSAAAMLAAPYMLARLFPSFVSMELLPTLIGLTRIMLLQPILLGCSNILAAITQARRRYVLYSLSPLLYNTGIIFGLLALYPVFGLQGIAWGVVIGALLHVGIQVPSVIADGFFQRIPRIRDPRALFRTIAVSIPRALTLSMNQITVIGLTALAAALASGSVAIFTFAYNLQAVPLSIIGASYSVAAFPALAAALSNGHKKEFVRHIALAARYVFFWSIPASALMLVLRAHVVRAILGSGAFDWTDTRLTAAAFALFGLSLAAQGLTLLLVRGYYAAGKTFVPFFVALGSAIATIALTATCTHISASKYMLDALQSSMRVDGLAGTSVLAIPFAYAIVSILATIILAIHFNSRFGGFFAEIGESFRQSIVAAAAGGFAAYAALAMVGPLTLSSTLLSVLVRGFAGGAGGIAGIACAYVLLKNREYADTLAGIRAKVWRSPLPPAQPIASSEDVAP